MYKIIANDLRKRMLIISLYLTFLYISPLLDKEFVQMNMQLLQLFKTISFIIFGIYAKKFIDEKWWKKRRIKNIFIKIPELICKTCFIFLALFYIFILFGLLFIFFLKKYFMAFAFFDTSFTTQFCLSLTLFPTIYITLQYASKRAEKMKLIKLI